MTRRGVIRSRRQRRRPLVYHIAGGHLAKKQHFTHWFKELDGDPQKVELEDKTQDNGAPVVMKWSSGRALKPTTCPPA